MNRTIIIFVLLNVVICGSGIAGIFIYKGITEKSNTIVIAKQLF